MVRWTILKNLLKYGQQPSEVLMELIPRGSVVTVLSRDNEFEGKQGILEEDAISPDAEIKVKFGKEYSYLFGPFRGCEVSVQIRADQLRKDSDFTPENRAQRLFEGRWNVVYTLRDPFDPNAGHDCQRESCEKKATRRILVNIWGTVCEYETCEECGEVWHGKLVDDFPVKSSTKQ